MSEEIKFDPVFGPQELFNSASDDAVLAIKDTTSGRIHFFTNKGWIKSGLKHERYIGTSYDEIAMRRIIKEPKRWTWEDKKAGVLPEVGSLCCDESFTFKVINVTEKYVVIETMQSSDVYSLPHHSFMSSCNPIETPAEKAQRLEDEWVNKAWGETAVFAGVTQDEHDRLRIHLRHIYRAQLSGELAADMLEEVGVTIDRSELDEALSNATGGEE